MAVETRRRHPQVLIAIHRQVTKPAPTSLDHINGQKRLAVLPVHPLTAAMVILELLSDDD